jgi:predicted AlkP superfamily pyrophosphatase or phosphodiesterase
MSIRATLPLLSLCILGACASNTGGSGLGEGTSTVTQAEQGQDEQGQDEDEQGGPNPEIRRVVLISVDGLHQTDVDHFIASHPGSTFAALANRGVEYSDAHTTTPSDSFPGLAALVTGGTPKSTGLYYDDSYDRTIYPPSSNCQKPGTELQLFETLAVDFTQLFSPINPANLPEGKDAQGNCKPLYPHELIFVNTIFEVIRAAGGHTAWSDKHQAYDWTNGPSGKGVEDLYTPEVNSLIANGGTANGVNLTATLALCDGTTNSLPKVGDYTTCEPSIMAYDDVKVQAVVNEINGRTSDGSKRAPVPTIMGMNFQQVSVAQKLPVGGYADADGTPSALLEGAMEHVDESLGRMVSALKSTRRYASTLFIVSAKHGQSPVDIAKLAMEPGGHGNATVTDPLGFINAADPNVSNVFNPYINPNDGSQVAIEGWLQTDDVGLVWLQDQSPVNIAGVEAQLFDPANRTAMFADVLPPGTIFDSNINAGAELAAIYGDPTSGDPIAAARAPNVIIQPNWGVIYSTSSKKIAEHGGGTLDDTHVGLIVSNPALRRRTVNERVSTTQVAPTILKALDLDPEALDAVRKEGTRTLPGLF